MAITNIRSHHDDDVDESEIFTPRSQDEEPIKMQEIEDSQP